MINFLIIIFGLIIRIYLILERNIFTDEVFYIEVAIRNSIKDIIFINHWIKDHGILYYLFLKPFLFFTKTIEILRFSNIFLYILISIFIIYTFNKIFRKKYLTTAFLFLYSFNHYFIYLNSWISPFNLVSFFAVVSIFSLIYFILKNNLDKEFYFYYFLFIVSTILAFYSDYSFFYLAIFYFLILIYILFKLIIKKGGIKKSYLILNSYLIILIFIIPGIFQFINNFERIIYLFRNIKYETSGFFSFLNHLLQIIFFRKDNYFSLIFFLILIFLNILLNLKNKIANRFLYVNNLVLFSLIGTIFLLFFTNKFFLTLMIERSFWPFYLFVIILSAFTIYFLSESKFKLIKILGALLSIFFVFGLFTETNTSFIPSSIKEEINYKKLINSQKNTGIIVLIDELYFYYPISNYYFNPIFQNKFKNKSIKIYNIRSKNIEHINDEIKKILEMNQFEKNISIIFFNCCVSYKNYLYLNLNNNYPNKNIRIYDLFSQEKNLVTIFK